MVREKILLIRLGAMGDLVHLSPSIDAIKQDYPYAKIDILTEAGYLPLLSLFNNVDTMWPIQSKAFWTSIIKLIPKLHAQRYTHIINLQPSLKTIVSSVLFRNKAILTTLVKEKNNTEREHSIETFYKVIGTALNLPRLDLQTLKPKLKLVTPAKNYPLNEEKPLTIGIIPGVGGNRPNRAWPIEQYKSLCLQLLNEFLVSKIIIIGSDAERELGETLQIDSRIKNKCKNTPISEAAALLAECDFILGGDTGPTHLAAAMNIPVITFFGSSSVGRSRPVGENKVFILKPPTTIACSPCKKRACQNTDDPNICMTSILPQDAIEACKRLFASQQSERQVFSLRTPLPSKKVLV